MNPSSFEALLCDIDGVLRLWDPAVMPGLDRAYGLPPGTLAGAAWRAERVMPAVTGAMTDEEWRAAIAEDLAAVCGSLDMAGALVADWTARGGRIDEEVLGLLTTARERMPVVLVSNGTTRLEADLAALGVAGAVDAVVNSARVGVAKPEAAIYRHAAEVAGVDVSRCLFVDDLEENAIGARAVGMTGLHYREVRDLAKVLVGPDRGN